MPAVRQGLLAYAAGGTVRQEITTPHAVSKIEVRVTGTLTVGVAEAALVEDGVLNIIRTIRVTKASRPVLQFGLGDALLSGGKLLSVWDRFWYQELPTVNQPAVGVATNAFDYSVFLPFRFSENLFRGAQPRDGLDAGCIRRDGERIDVEIDFGVDTDVATPGGGGTAVVAAELEIIYHSMPELAQVPPEYMNKWLRTTTESVGIGTALNPADQQRLNAALGLEPFMMLLAVDNDCRDPDFLNRVRVLLNGTDMVYDQSWDAVVSHSRALAGLQVALPDGYGMVDFDERRDMSGALPMGAGNVASSVLETDHDATAGGNVRLGIVHAFRP